MSTAPDAAPVVSSDSSPIINPISAAAASKDDNNNETELTKIPLATKADDDTKSDKSDKSKEEEEEVPRVSLGELFQYANCCELAMLWTSLICAFISGAGMSAFSELFGQMVDTLVTTPKDLEDKMAELGFWLTMIGIIILCLSAVYVALATIMAEKQARKIREKYFEAVLRQECAFHDSEKPGGLAARLFGDTVAIRNGINDKLSTGAMNFGMFIFGFGFGFYHSWRMTLVMLGTMPLIAGAGAYFAKILEDSVKNARENYAQAGDISDEVMSNIRTVQSFGSEERESARFEAALQEAHGHGVVKEFATVAGVGGVYCVMFSSYALAFWFAGYLVENGYNTVSEITAVFFAVLMGSFGIGLIFPSISALVEAQGAAHKVYAIIERKSAIDPWQPGEKIENLQGEISFKNMGFKYPTREEQLFKDVNLTIKAGEHVAFSGASGCGKSSFIALVQRMYDPVEGQVFIDGVDLKDLDLDWWRSQLGVVSQEPVMFSGTIADNLRLSKHDATEEDMRNACKRANIHDLIMTLPDKYQTNVGSATMSQLSGGQKQRLAIARALIREPRVLILDEATSALDRQSEIEVQTAIDALMKTGGRKLTILVIAHRLQTIREVDTIHFIEHDPATGSKIAESGSFDELLAKGGLFAQMASRQSKSLGILDADSQNPQVSDEKTAEAFKNRNAATTVDIPSADGGAIIAADDDDKIIAAKKTSHTFDEDAFEIDEETGKPKVDEKGNRIKKKTALDLEVEKELEEVDASMGRVYNLMPKKWPVYLGLLGSVMAGGVYPVYAIVLSKVLEIIGKGPQEIRDQIPLWSPMFVVVAFGALIGWLLQGFYGYAGEDLTLVLRRDAFRAILRQDMKFFDLPGRDPGALQALLSGDCESVHQLWGPSIGTKIQMACNLLAGIIIGMIFSWKLALVTLSAAPIMVMTGAVQQAMVMGFGALSGESTATVVTESLHNIRTVTSFNVHRRQVEIYSESLDEAEQAGMKLAIGAGIAFGFSQFSFYGVFALALWYGGKLIAEGEIDFFDTMVAAMAVLMGAIGAGEAGGWAAKLMDAENAAKKVFALLDRSPDIDVRIEGDKDISMKPNISFEEVEFKYPSRPNATVLKSFSTATPYGSSLGFCGATGSGKSTSMQLLLRFYKASSGNVTVDGKPLDTLDVKTWRSRIAAVQQEPSLFSGTIRQNIKYTNEDATEEDMIEAAKIANIHEEIMEMADKYDTQVGLKGSKLSGGQKARVALSRALCSKRPILIMDETTAALDNANQAIVAKNIEAVRKERGLTMIQIAHRLSVLTESDKIILLDNGVVLESGNHNELMAMNGEYKQRYDTFVAGSQ